MTRFKRAAQKMALFQFVISMPASVNKYERQSCRKERLKHTRKVIQSLLFKTCENSTLVSTKSKKGKKNNSQNDIPKDRHLSVRVGSQRLCTSCFTVFWGITSSRRVWSPRIQHCQSTTLVNPGESIGRRHPASTNVLYLMTI